MPTLSLSKYNFNRISENSKLEAFNMYMLNRFKPRKNSYYYELDFDNANVKNLTRFANSLNKIGFRGAATDIRKDIRKKIPKQTKPSPKNVKKNITTLTAAKKVLHRSLALRAGKAYTRVWNEVISEANNIKPKRNNRPPGFRGTMNQKYNRARLYKKRMIQWMHSHPMNYKRPLYRGVYGAEARMFRSSDVVVKNNLTSFSKSFEVAFNFASKGKGNNNTRPLILKLNPVDKLPSINYTNKLFTSKYAKEQEVLLPPGVFEVIKRPKMTTLFQNLYGNFKPFDMIIVKFKPSNKM